MQGDPNAEGEAMVLQPGMRVRLTRNLDKDRGFVNGNTGVIEAVLSPQVFILKSLQGTRILVHPVTDNGVTFATRRNVFGLLFEVKVCGT